MNPTEVKKPKVTEELAKELTHRIYGLKVISIKKMVSYDDQNYHIKVLSEHENPYITTIANDGYTLKITNTAKSALTSHFDSMHAAMIHLHGKGLRVPLPVLNKERKTWKLEKVPLLNEGVNESEEPSKCGIHLLTFLVGQPVSTVTYTTNVLFQWGSLLAHFHNATEDLTSDYLKEKNIFWDLQHIPELKRFTDVLDDEKKSLVHSVLDEYPEQIEKRLPKLQKGFIHGDFNENNILCQNLETSTGNEKKYTVDGVLDFEDMHYGTYAWDLGVMLAYALLDCKNMNPLEGAGHALAGYLKYRQLDDLDITSLQMCIACRLCQSLVLGAYSYKLDPSNSYLIISARFGWDRLKQVWNTKNEDLLKLWKVVQNSYDFDSQ